MKTFLGLLLLSVGLTTQAAIVYPPGPGTGGGVSGSATNALTQVLTNGVAAGPAVITNLNFNGSANIDVPATNGNGTVGVTPTLKSNLTGIASIAGNSFSVDTNGNFSTLGSVFSSVFYASPTGAVTGIGTIRSPWALGYAVSNAGPGSTTILLPGTYTNPASIRPAFKNMTLRAAVKWTARLDNIAGDNAETIGADAGIADGLTIDGLEFGTNQFQAVVFRTGLSNATVRNCLIRYTGSGWAASQSSSGILIMNGLNCLVENNLLEYNGNETNTFNHGIYVGGTNCVVRNNVTRYNQGYGIQLQNSPSTTTPDKIQVYGNLGYGNAGSGGTEFGQFVDFSSGGSGGTNYIWNNTFVSVGSAAVTCQGTHGDMLTNNIIISTNVGVSISSATVYGDYNLSTNTLTLSVAGSHNVVTNSLITSLFVNPANGLYWLSYASGARSNSLATIYSPVDYFANYKLFSSDIGALQFNGAVSADGRALDPSPSYGADYWQSPLAQRIDGNLLNNFPNGLIVQAPTNGSDATAAIQSYLDAATNGQRTVYIPAGVYTISSVGLDLRSGTTLIGETAPFGSQGTTLNQASGTVGCIRPHGIAWKISNVFLTGSTTTYGIYATNCYEAVLNEVRTFGFTNGVFFNNSWDVTMKEVYATGGNVNANGIVLSNTVNNVKIYGGTQSICSNGFWITGGSCTGNGFHSQVETCVIAVRIDGLENATDLTGTRYEGNTNSVNAANASGLVIANSLMLAKGTNIVLTACDNVTGGNNVVQAQRNIVADSATYMLAQANDYVANVTSPDVDASFLSLKYQTNLGLLGGIYSGNAAGLTNANYNTLLTNLPANTVLGIGAGGGSAVALTMGANMSISGGALVASAGSGANLTNLTYQYTTNRNGAVTLLFGTAYWTNVAANLTITALTVANPAFYESGVLWVTNSSSSDRTITWPSGVIGPVGTGTPSVMTATNKTITRFLYEHLGPNELTVSKTDYGP